jgi:hypothetical protein
MTQVQHSRRKEESGVSLDGERQTQLLFLDNQNISKPVHYVSLSWCSSAEPKDNRISEIPAKYTQSSIDYPLFSLHSAE